MNNLKLDCGCEFETKNGIPLMPLKIEDINLGCQKTWNLISSGQTVGVFQIESGLGQSLSKRLKPRNIEHLSALISIMRPSCLNGKLSDGKSITDHYIDRKNGKEEVKADYPALEYILKDNYGLALYQEDAIKIAKEIAGFSLQKADLLRKSLGKKLPELMSTLEKEFIEGCQKQNKVSDKESQEIFNFIKAGQRYSFCRGHAISYSMNTYLTAYAKTHFSIRFFKSWLNHACDKIKPLEEIKNLVLDAKNFGVDICPPDLRLKNIDFIEKDGRIYYGLGHIKSCGKSGIASLVRAVGKFSLESTSWTTILFGSVTEDARGLLGVNKSVVKPLIGTGGLDWLKIDRERLLLEHDIALKFTKKEIDWIVNNIDLSQHNSLEPIFTDILSHPVGKGQPIANKNRKNILKSLEYLLINQNQSYIMTIERKINVEKSYLGIALSCSLTDLISKELADSFVKEVLDGKTGTSKLIVELNRVKVITTKKDQDMAFLQLCDASGLLNDCVAFPEVYLKYKDLLIENNVVLVIGYRGDRENFIVTKVKQV